MPKRKTPKQSAKASQPAEVDTPRRVKFDLVKGNLFRGIHADGVWGGGTPQGLIALTFFSERFAIPQQVTHIVNPDDSLGAELTEARVARDAIVRDAEVCVYMTAEVAESLRKFLDHHLQLLKKVKEQARNRRVR